VGAGGGLLGLGIAWLAVRWLQVIRPDALPRYDALGLHGPVLAFGVAAVLATVMVFGLLPAISAARADGRLAFGDRGSVGSGRLERRVRDLGVSLQVALALVLLTAGGLLARSFLSLYSTDLGFDPRDVLTFQLRLPDYAYADPERRIAFYDELFARLDADPGIAASGATSKLPANGHRNHWGFGIEGRERTEGRPGAGAEIRCVAGRVLEALEVDLARGRGLGEQDRPSSERVALVNQALVERYFPEDDALGTRIQVGGQPRTIVGVVRDTRHDPAEPGGPKIYIPQAQFADDRNWDLTFAVAREAGAGTAWPELRARVEATVAEIDPRLVMYDLRTMGEVAAEPIARQRFGAQLMLTFAATSLLLAGVGLFGALAYSLRQRRGELGVRMALGADRHRVLAAMLGHGLRLFGVGAAFGLVGVWAVGRWLESVLHQVHPRDPLALSAAVGLLLAVALAASAVPARRAASLDPAEILREP
ncbi:MAG: ABC transporter permease, partial [Holophagales bacterium]|nr:ABC transporter permease [Holophagales bacterium]